MKRQLTEQEKELTLKNLEAIKNEIKYCQYKIDICTVELNVGVDARAHADRKKHEALRNEVQYKLEELNFVYESSLDQINNGVEVPENTEEVK